MTLFPNQETNQFTRAVLLNAVVTSLVIKARDTLRLELKFHDGAALVALAEGAQIVFAVKTGVASSSATLALATEWELLAPGYYRGTLNLNTAPLISAVADLKALAAVGELTWNEGAGWESSNTLAVRIENDVYKGVEGTPQEMPSPLVWLGANLKTLNGESLVGTGDVVLAGGPGGGGDASTDTAVSVDGELVLFSGTTGKILRRATLSGNAKLLNGVLVAANVDLASEVAGQLPAANGGTGSAFFTAGGMSAARTYTFPNQNAVILSSAAAVTVAQGGSGRGSGGTAYGLIAAGITAEGVQQTISPGTTAGHYLRSAGGSALPGFSAILMGEVEGLNAAVSGLASKTAINEFTQLQVLRAGAALGVGALGAVPTDGVLVFYDAGSVFEGHLKTANLTNLRQWTLRDMDGDVAFLSDISASGGGDTSTNTDTSADGQLVVFSGASGKLLKRATESGVAKLVSGVLSAGTVSLTTEVAGILPVANGGTNNAFFGVAGPAGAVKTYTFPNATCAILTSNALVTAAQGGTGNAFFQVSGPASAVKTYTFPNATCTILTSNAPVTVGQGGTGRNTGSVANSLILTGTTDVGVQQTLSSGTAGHFLKSGGIGVLPAFASITTGDVAGLDTALTGKQPLATVLTNTTASFTSEQQLKLFNFPEEPTSESAQAAGDALAKRTSLGVLTARAYDLFSDTIGTVKHSVVAIFSGASRTHTLPDKSGTLAHTSDIPAFTAEQVLTPAASVVYNTALGWNARLTLDRDTTLELPANAPDGASGRVVITQDTVLRSLSLLDSGWKLTTGNIAGVASMAAGKRCVLSWTRVSSTEFAATLIFLP